MPRRARTCSRCEHRPAETDSPLCGQCNAALWHERVDAKTRSAGSPHVVSEAEATAERERIVHRWPALAKSLDVMRLDDDSGSYGLRVRGASSWRVVRFGNGPNESGSVFAETPL